MSPTPTLAPDAPAPRIAIVGLGACLPDAPDVATFWRNILRNHVAIREVPENRWSQSIYYDPERLHMDRTYSRIGGFICYEPHDVRRFRMMPRSLPSIDDIQKFALVAVAEALADAKLRVFAQDTEGRAFDRSRCAVILGNAMGGEAEDRSSLRVWLLEVLDEMKRSAQAAGLNAQDAEALAAATLKNYGPKLPTVTEDTMPGELSNCIAGRITNVFDLQGPNFTTDAACASSFAALEAGVRGLQNGDFDTAIVGGADRSMDPPTFVKFCRIGALSGRHSAPFDAEANGFVMGEGVGVVVIKRLADAQRDGDDIQAVICGIGGSSDGRGKALTAPNPRGQRLAVERAWQQAGLPLSSVGLLEAHGTGTPVGDGVEAEVLTSLLEQAEHKGAPVPIGSVKSMIGHLKSAAGAAALIKTTLALRHGTLPPSANFRRFKEGSAFERGKLAVNGQTRPWDSAAGPRRAGISAFGFGGTNFHVVLEEAPQSVGHKQVQGMPEPSAASAPQAAAASAAQPTSLVALHEEVVALFAEKSGYDVSELDPQHELEADLGIDSVKQAEILAVLRARFGVADEARVAISELNTIEKVVRYIAEQGAGSHAAPASAAPSVALPAAQKPPEASDSSAAPMPAVAGPRVFAFGGQSRADVLSRAQAVLARGDEAELRAARAQAASAPVRLALAARDLEDACARVSQAESMSARLLSARGIFLAEGQGLATDGKLAFIFPGQGSQYLGMLQDLAAQFPVVKATFAEADEALLPHLGGKLTDIVWPKGRDEASEEELKQTQNCQPAMLTADVALARLLGSFGVLPDVVAGHSLGEYAAAVVAGVLPFADALYAVSARGREMANVKVDDPGRMAMVAAPASVVEATLSQIDGYVIAANKNCFTQTVIAGATVAVEAAIQAFAKAGIEARGIAVSHAFHSRIVAPAAEPLERVLAQLRISPPTLPLSSNVDAEYYSADRDSILDRLSKQLASPVQFIDQVQRLYADGARLFVECGPKRATTGFVRNILGDKPMRALASNHPKRPSLDMFLELLAALTAEGVAVRWPGDDVAATPAAAPRAPRVATSPSTPSPTSSVSATNSSDSARVFTPADDAIVISGASVLIPGGHTPSDWQDDPFDALLRGDNCIEPIEQSVRQAMQHKRIVRLEKTHGRFIEVTDASQVPQLAGRMGPLALDSWGVDDAVAQTLEASGRMALASGIDALRDAGLPLVEHLRETSTGSFLKDRIGLPRDIGARTGVIMASAFPNLEAILHEAERNAGTDSFDRKWLFRALPMGHAQLAQMVLAQGPSVQLNAACASGTQALGMAADWIRLGRCDRVIVVTADDVTAPASLPWVGAGFLAAGAASTEADVTRAAAPFQTHRNGMILGSGAATFVVERQSEVHKRGMIGIAELRACEFANSAFHATRLDGSFISHFLQNIIGQLPDGNTAEGRAKLAHQLAFLSHETYTPARGGSAAAEIQALRHVFGAAAKDVLIANTKGHTGHPMGASFEDLVAIKGLQRQQLPPIANLHEPDPAFADLRFARGGSIDTQYALRFAAGFGSQVAAAAYVRVACQEARLTDPARYASWCQDHGMGAQARFRVHHRQLQAVASGGVPIEELGIRSLAHASPRDAQSPAPVSSAAHVAVPAASLGTTANEALSPAKNDDGARGTGQGLDEASMLRALTGLFAEHTGYAIEELDPDHAIEADLGVDSVKQAEVLAIVRERFAISQDHPLVLAELQTLRAMAHAIAKAAGPADASVPAEAAPPTVAAPSSPPAAPVAADAPAAAAAPTASAEQVLAEITQLFAEETGYEAAELQPDHALEADLGIDSIKQAELMAKMRESYALGEDPAFRLAEVQTLRGLAGYVVSRRSRDGKPTAEPQASAAAATPESIATATPPAASSASVGAPWTGPLERGGVQARPVVLLPHPAPKMAASAKGLWACALGEPDASRLVDAFCARGAQKLALDDARIQDGHVLLDATASPQSTGTSRLPLAEALFVQARTWARNKTLPASVAVVVAGHGFGFGPGASADADGVADAAAVSGVIKTLAREWPQTRFVVVSAMDLPEKGSDVAPLAAAIVSLTRSQPAADAPVEWVAQAQANGSMQLSTPVRARAAANASDAPLAAHALVVATGGARGVTFALLEALAKRRPLDIVVLARSRGFGPGEDVLSGATDDARRTHAKEQLAQRSDRVTPAMVKAWLASYDARREVTDNLQRLAALGSRVEHLPCDVSDPKAREQAVARIASRQAPVALLLHGAGIEESRFIKDKASEDFARVTAPKWDALIALREQLSPKRTVTMGSIAGRFGNAGQADYAAANNALAAVARLPDQGMLNIAWTAWDGAGMATRGSVRRVLEAAGITLLPLADGVALGAALIESSHEGEVVVAGRLGALEANEAQVPACFDEARIEGETITLSRTFVPSADEGLDHHRIDKVAVLPGVIGVELMQQASAYVLGMPVTSLSDVSFRAPVKFFHDRALQVDVQVTPHAPSAQEPWRAEVCVATTFVSPVGRAQRREHFVARVPADDVEPSPTSLPSLRTLARAALPPLSREDIYRRYFHGPSFQVLEANPQWGDAGIVAQTMPAQGAWAERMSPETYASSPFGREAGFQAAGLLEMVDRDHMALPSAIERLWLVGDRPAAGERLWVEVACTAKGDDGCTFDIVQRACDADGAPGRIVDVMRGYRSIVLRPLNDDETFREREQADKPASGYARLMLADVESLLQPGAADELSQYLCAEERTQLGTMKVKKRKADWLAGRLVAKRCIVDSWRLGADVPSFDELLVRTGELGEPLVSWVARAGRAGVHPSPHALPRVSISHAAGTAVAACSWDEALLPGIDVQQIKRRDPSFAKTYFTDDERATVKEACAHPHVRQEGCWTIRWALKEATLKALGIGARVDFKDLHVSPLQGEAGRSWTVRLSGEAQAHATSVGATLSSATVEHDGEHVIAQVWLQTQRKARATQRKLKTKAAS